MKIEQEKLEKVHQKLNNIFHSVWDKLTKISKGTNVDERKIKIDDIEILLKTINMKKTLNITLTPLQKMKGFTYYAVSGDVSISGDKIHYCVDLPYQKENKFLTELEKVLPLVLDKFQNFVQGRDYLFNKLLDSSVGLELMLEGKISENISYQDLKWKCLGKIFEISWLKLPRLKVEDKPLAIYKLRDILFEIYPKIIEALDIQEDKKQKIVENLIKFREEIFKTKRKNLPWVRSDK